MSVWIYTRHSGVQLCVSRILEKKPAEVKASFAFKFVQTDFQFFTISELEVQGQQRFLVCLRLSYRGLSKKTEGT